MKDILPSLGKVKMATPTTIIIFGVTGDLARKKLIPALIDLQVKKVLPKQFKIIGFSRREWSDARFKTYLKQVLRQSRQRYGQRVIEVFLANTHFVQGNFDRLDNYQALATRLEAIDTAFHTCSNKLFYLAVPPAQYRTIFNNLSRSGLTIPCIGVNEGWTRVLVEKPFGHDLQTAQELDAMLGRLFQEKQIFRIDHYLAKETIQNILMFRFSNRLFEPIWNKDNIEKVEIKFLETLGTVGRGEFYDDIGALRDVGQNHLLQMLAAIAMEDPRNLDVATVRSERAKVLQALQPITEKNVGTMAIRGQYQGFTKEKAVAGESKTETYFKVKAFLNLKRWQGVPFYLEAGKRLKNECHEIKVYFKHTDSCFCPPDVEQHYQNILTFRIKPREGITIRFWAKMPGLTLSLEPKEFSFEYGGQSKTKGIPDAYEQVLFDCIRGDQMRFLSTDEVIASWKFITPILGAWKALPLHAYKPGSHGPDPQHIL